MPTPETLLYGPAQQAVNNGISQVFDYGIGMTCLGLFLAASIMLNVVLIRYFLKHGKDQIKVLADVFAVMNEIKDIVHDHA